MNRQEILDGISTIKLDCQEFEHELEDSQFTRAEVIKYVETENYNIALLIEETVKWNSYDDNEFYDLNIKDIEVIDINGTEYSDNFTEDELLNCINY